MKPKRGRPYGYPAIAEMQEGNSVLVAHADLKRANATIKTLEKGGRKFDPVGVTDNGDTHFRRVA